MLVEKWDAEDLDAWGASGWLVENAKKRSEKLEKRWKIDGMLFEKILGDSEVWGMKWYAVGESGWEICILLSVCFSDGSWAPCRIY